MSFLYKSIIGFFVLLFLLLIINEVRFHPYLWYKIKGGGISKHSSINSCIDGGEIAGVIRNSGNGWYVINDKDHKSLNIDSVETTANYIRVYYSFNAKYIYTFSVSSDEALIKAGIIAGASVGLNSSTIQLSKISLMSSGKVSPLVVDTHQYPFSNLWISGRFEAFCSD